MSTDNVTTWRDLADQLTPEQVAEIEYCERHQIPPGIASEQTRINHARALIRSNLAQAFCADMPAPADAIDTPSEWIEWDDQHYERVYTAHQSAVNGASITVVGYQRSDGSYHRGIYVDGTLENLDSGTARTLAAALTEAADQLDRLGDS